jgi:hypothetical protein
MGDNDAGNAGWLDSHSQVPYYSSAMAQRAESE